MGIGRVLFWALILGGGTLHAHDIANCQIIIKRAAENGADFGLTMLAADVASAEAFLVRGERDEGFDLGVSMISEGEGASPEYYLQLYLWLYQRADSPALKVSLLEKLIRLENLASSRVNETAVRRFVDDEDSSSVFLESVLDHYEGPASLRELQVQHMREQLDFELKRTAVREQLSPFVAQNLEILERHGVQGDLFKLERLRGAQNWEPYTSHRFEIAVARLNERLHPNRDHPEAWTEVYEGAPIIFDVELVRDQGLERALSVVRERQLYLTEGSLGQLMLHAVEVGDFDLVVALMSDWGLQRGQDDFLGMLELHIRSVSNPTEEQKYFFDSFLNQRQALQSSTP